MLKSQRDRAMKELQSLKMQNADTVKKLELSTKEADFFKVRKSRYGIYFSVEWDV